MKQKMQYIQTLKQTLKLNQKLLKSLDFFNPIESHQPIKHLIIDQLA